MKVLSTNVKGNDTVFQVELDSKIWKSALAKEKKNIAKNITIQGFRKGHVPQAEIDKRVSDTEVAMRALESLQNKLVEELFKTKEFQESDCLDSVSNLKVIKFTPTPVIDVSVELVPKVSDFSTKDIKDITIPAFVEPTIKDEMVKQQIRMMIRQDAMVSIKKDGIVAKGDIAVIDFKGFVDNKPFKGGEGKNYELEIGSKSFIDNFEDQLIGCKKGNKKDVNVTFPKEYGSKELAGKPAKFEVVIKEVKQIEYPKITKDYCKKFMMDCANMQELEAHVKDLFRQEAVMKHQDTSLRIINEAISKKAKLNYFPKSLIEMHKNQILQQWEQEAYRYGIKTLQEFKKRMGVDEAKFNETIEGQAKSNLIVTLTLDMLKDEYKLKATEAELKDYQDKLARYLGDAKKAKEYYEKNNEVAEQTVIRDQLLKKLVQEAKKETKKVK